MGKPSPATLTLACPPAQTRLSPNGLPVSVTWPNATTTGGRSPVKVTYYPAQGSALPVGVTTIQVRASSRDNQVKTCSFTVTVSIPVALPPDYPPSDLTAVEV